MCCADSSSLRSVRPSFVEGVSSEPKISVKIILFFLLYTCVFYFLFTLSLAGKVLRDSRSLDKNWSLEFGDWSLEFGDWSLEIGDWVSRFGEVSN